MPPLHPIIQRFIEDAGAMTQSLGIGRVMGQIYAYLYFSREPRSLNDMQSVLGISKGSASMMVRQLEQWNAVRKVWVRGDRRDYYEANDWIGQILRNILRDTVGKKLSSAAEQFDIAKAGINGRIPANDPERAFIEARLDRLRKFHGKAHKVWNSAIVRVLLK